MNAINSNIRVEVSLEPVSIKVIIDRYVVVSDFICELSSVLLSLVFDILSVLNNRAAKEPEKDSRDVVSNRWLVMSFVDTVEYDVVINIADGFRSCRMTEFPIV